MPCRSALFLTYYNDPDDLNRPVLKNIIKNNCPAHLPFDIYMEQPLKNIFGKVNVYDYLRRRADTGIKAMNEEIVSLVKKEKPAYAIWSSFYYDVHASTLDRIRAEGTRVIGWFFDDDWRFDDYSRWWAPHLDYAVTGSRELLSKYNALGVPATFTVPNTGVYIEKPPSEFDFDVTFVGTIAFADRSLLLGKLRQENINIDIFGAGSSGYLPFDKMLQVFGTSKINLNFSKTAVKQERRQLKGRIFQVCMAGGFLLTERTPGIEEFFRPDKEIICFDNPDDMVEKAKYYLKHEEARLRIARAGWERARAYTSNAMVAGVFEKIEQLNAYHQSSERASIKSRPLPIRVRRQCAWYHFQWFKSMVEINYHREFWKDELAAILQFDPLRLEAWFYGAAGYLFPLSIRPVLFKLYNSTEIMRTKLRAGW